MNIYIDFAKGKIEKVTPAPIYFGDNNVDKITLYFKNIADGVEWYPTLSALCSDNNPIYPRLFDTDGTGTKTIDGVDYTYYEFTLSNSNGWNLTPGRTLFYVWVNYPNTNGNKCVGTFGCTILGTSGYYQVDNPVVNPALREYLENSFEQHYNEVDEKFDSLEEEFNDEYTEEVNAQRDLINNLIGGEPRYVNTSSNILALTSNQGVAVATDNGHWYYWDGEKYVDGGVYQATENNTELYKIKTNNTLIDLINNNNSFVFKQISLTKVQGYYYNEYGVETQYAYGEYSIVDVIPNNVYKFNTSLLDGMPSYVLLDANDNLVSYGTIATSTTRVNVEITIPSNAYKLIINSIINNKSALTTPYIIVKDEIITYNDLSSDIKQLMYKKYNAYEPSSIVSNEFVSIENDYYLAKYTYNGISNAKIPVKKGESYKLKYPQIGNDCVYAFVDENDLVNEYYPLTNEQLEYEVTFTAKYDGYLYFNIRSGSSIEKVDLGVNVTNVLYNKKWAVIGDSINEYNQTASKNWIKWMIEGTGVDVTNLAVGGTGFCAGYNTNSNYINKIPLIPNDADIITIAVSFNDLGNVDLPVGTTSDSGNTTLCGYINDFFDALLTAYPLKSIGVYTTGPWLWFRPNHEKTESFLSAIKTICRNRGIPFYDECFYNSGLKPWIDAFNNEYYHNITVDGVTRGDYIHPNNKGHKFLYPKLRPFIEKLLENY